MEANAEKGEYGRGLGPRENISSSGFIFYFNYGEKHEEFSDIRLLSTVFSHFLIIKHNLSILFLHILD